MTNLRMKIGNVMTIESRINDCNEIALWPSSVDMIQSFVESLSDNEFAIIRQHINLEALSRADDAKICEWCGEVVAADNELFQVF